MVECSGCGISDGVTTLFDVISSEGIVKVCKDCLSPGSVSLTKPSETQINNIHKKESLYNRLSKDVGLNPEEHKKNIFGTQQQEDLKKKEVNLRSLIERNLEENGPIKKTRRDDLIDNFHWVLMRARRMKKMSIFDLAKEIGEREAVVSMAEKGNIPEGGYDFILKLEKALSVRILKPEIAERIENQKTQLGFDKTSSNDVTIADLRDRSPGAEGEKVPYWKRFMFGKKKKAEAEDLPEEGDVADVEFDDTSLQIEGRKVDKKDLSQEDIDDLIFGR